MSCVAISSVNFCSHNILYIRDNNYDNHFVETFIAQNKNNCSSIVACDLELNYFHVAYRIWILLCEHYWYELKISKYTWKIWGGHVCKLHWYRYSICSTLWITLPEGIFFMRATNFVDFQASTKFVSSKISGNPIVTRIADCREM